MSPSPTRYVRHLHVAQQRPLPTVCPCVLQARIVCLNGSYFLKNGGHFVISIKANCIDSTVPAATVFESERGKLAAEGFKPQEQLTLEPYERDHAVVTGTFRGSKKKA